MSRDADELRARYGRNLQEVALDVSAISCRCFVWSVSRTNRSAGLVAFAGTYRPGSAGKDDALFIRWRLDEFYSLERPFGVVVDFRQLDYVRGDDLSLGKLEAQDDVPVRIIIRREQIEAFRHAFDDKLVRVDVDQAFAEVAEDVRRRKA